MPAPKLESPLAMKCCVVAELLATPVPPISSERAVSLVGNPMVKALAPELNTMLSTSTVDDNETAVLLEVANVATSGSRYGTVCGVQFVAVFQSFVSGLAFQVALPAKLLLASTIRRQRTMPELGT